MNLRISTRNLLISASALIGGFVVSPPSAAIAAEPAASTGIEEIVVTAERRSENLMNVPVSVTVFNGEELGSNQIVNVSALQGLVPNVTVTGSLSGESDMLVGMRGLGADQLNANTDPTVGLYVDGIYLGRTQGSNVAMIDMDDVEVLRGPQGTLFGRNTIGGALTINTKAPTDAFEGELKLGGGNYNGLTATGILNVPVIPGELDLRIVYDHQQHSGYYTDTDPAVSRSLNDQRQDYVRVSLKATPTSNLTAVLRLDHFVSEQHAQIFVLNYYDPAIATGVSNTIGSTYYSKNATSTNTDENPLGKDVVDDANATIDWDLGWAQVKSITGLRMVTEEAGLDEDASPLRVIDLPAYYDKQHQFSQEIQLYGKSLDDKLDWIVGLYYLRESINAGYVVGTPTVFAASSLPDAVNTSKSGYAQASYEILPGVKLTAGVRYGEDDKTATYSQPNFSSYPNGARTGCRLPAALVPAPNLTNCTYVEPPISFHYLPWTVGIDYKPTEDLLFYAKETHGTRDGSYQLYSASSAPGFTPVGAESVQSSEVGTRQSLFDDSLLLSAAAYYANYSNIQQNVAQPIPGTSTIFLDLINSGTATVYGGEFEATAQIESLRVRASLGLAEPTDTSGPYKGVPFTEVSKTDWSLGADYPVQFSLGTLTLHSDYTWQSKQFVYAPVNTNTIPFKPLTQGQTNSISIGAYGLLNALASFEFEAAPDCTLSIWGRNLTNQYYFTRTQANELSGINVATLGAPRTFGATIAYKF